MASILVILGLPSLGIASCYGEAHVGEKQRSLINSHVRKPLCRQVLQPLSSLLMITALASPLTTTLQNTLISGGMENRFWGTF